MASRAVLLRRYTHELWVRGLTVRHQRLLRSAGRRYFGPFPNGAPKSVRLSWRRRTEVRAAVPSLPVVIWVVIVIDATWAYLVVGGLAAWWGWGFAMLTRDIRRARRAELGH